MKSAPPPNYPILITLAYWHGDADMMRSLVKLCVGLQKEHAGRSCAFMLIARRDTPIDQDMVRLIATRFDVFSYQSNRFEKGWPQGPNGVFASTIIEVAKRRNDCDCMFWLETDCVPMRPDWHKILANEWKKRGNNVNIVGCSTTVDGNERTRHITGCALYDQKIALKLTKLIGPGHDAWDWGCRREMLGMGKNTEKVWLKFRYPTADPEWMNHSDPPAIIHGVKNKSLQNMVAEKYGVRI